MTAVWYMLGARVLCVHIQNNSRGQASYSVCTIKSHIKVCKLIGTKWKNLNFWHLFILNLQIQFSHIRNVFHSTIVEPQFYHVHYYAFFSWAVHFTQTFLPYAPQIFDWVHGWTITRPTKHADFLVNFLTVFELWHGARSCWNVPLPSAKVCRNG
jgi:hypothetical protein